MNISIMKRNSEVLIVFSALLLTYVPTWLWMWGRWFARDSYYSHGVLVPFVSAYLIWLRRDDLKAIVGRPSRSGLVLIILGILIHVVSSLFRVYFTSGFSLLIVFAGLVLHYWGKEVLRKIIFPIGFLIFMVPVPLIAVVNLSFKMKIFAAKIAAIILNNMGLYAVQDGSIIKMRHAFVIVDDICSGLRSLISLLALGSIFAFWLKGPMVKRVALFLMAFPIAVITNVCRVVFLASLGEIWGVKYATGFVHDATGFLVFGLAFVMLYMIGRIIE